MTVRLVPEHDPATLSENTLWRMTKHGCVVEARMRTVPLGQGVPELRLLYTRTDGWFDVLWNQVLKDWREVRERVQVKQRELEVRGWTLRGADVGRRWDGFVKPLRLRHRHIGSMASCFAQHTAKAAVA